MMQTLGIHKIQWHLRGGETKEPKYSHLMPMVDQLKYSLLSLNKQIHLGQLIFC